MIAVLDFYPLHCNGKSMSESTDMLRYDRMVENALRGVVRQAIEAVVELDDLPGDHHFYINFLTNYPGVEIPDYLRERYPGEMTIVLQYQFSGLSVDDETLRVTLSFNNIPEKLVIPLAAISIFADPSVNFALQFQPVNDSMNESLLDALEEITDEDDDPDGSGGGKKSSKKSKSDSDGSGEVISLDKFRKK